MTEKAGKKKSGAVSRQTLWQRRHRAMGLCIACSEPIYKGWRCARHYEKHKIAMRFRYIPRVRGRYDVGRLADPGVAARPSGGPGRSAKGSRRARSRAAGAGARARGAKG